MIGDSHRIEAGEDRSPKRSTAARKGVQCTRGDNPRSPRTRDLVDTDRRPLSRPVTARMTDLFADTPDAPERRITPSAAVCGAMYTPTCRRLTASSRMISDFRHQNQWRLTIQKRVPEWGEDRVEDVSLISTSPSVAGDERLASSDAVQFLYPPELKDLRIRKR